MANEKVANNKEKAAELKRKGIKRTGGCANSPFSKGDRATLPALESRMRQAIPAGKRPSGGWNGD